MQLFVDNQVVRSTVPDRFHAMFWESWDVSDLQGQTARIQIVDQDDREWAHIDVDQFFQTDLPPKGLKLQKKDKSDRSEAQFSR